MSFVYVILASSGHVKIGKADNVQARLATLKTASPFPLTVLTTIECDNPRKIESLLHKRFKAKKTNGEWFLLNPHDIAYLSEVNEETDIQRDIDNIEADCVYAADMHELWIDSVTPMWGEL